MVMNKSTSFQPVSGLVFSGRPPRSFPPFLVVWGGQTEREAPLCNLKLHAARFGVCVGLAALVGVLSGVGVRIWIRGAFSSNQISVVFSCFVSPVLM